MLWFESSIENIKLFWKSRNIINSLQFSLWLQFICLEMCTYASLKDMDAEKTINEQPWETRITEQGKKTEANPAWPSGANLRL